MSKELLLILVMDDEMQVRRVVAAILCHLGYKATTCSTGEEAIELYKTAKNSGDPFFAVILDIMVPGAMGGVEAAVRILSFDPEAKLIVSSGYSEEPVLLNPSHYGFQACLPKPYTIAELKKTLTSLTNCSS